MTPEESNYLLESLMMLTNLKQFHGLPMVREVFHTIERELDNTWHYDDRLWYKYPGGLVRALHLKDNYKPIVKIENYGQSILVKIVPKDDNNRVKDIITQQWGKI